MSRWERSGVRDLAFSQWHRESFNDDAKAFDVDLVGMCHRCDQPLYVIETTRSTAYKPTTWSQKLALQLNVPAFLVHYCTDDDGRLVSLSAQVLAPYCSRRLIGDADNLQHHLAMLRSNHLMAWHPETLVANLNGQLDGA